MQISERTFASGPRLRVSPDTESAVKRGHPWVFGSLEVPEPGTPVRIGDVGWGVADGGAIKVRVLGRGPAPDRTVADVLQERVQRADAFRWQVAPRETDCWRVVHGAGDGLPGIVADRYASTLVFKLYSAAWVPHQEALIQALKLPWVEGILRRLGVRNVDGSTGSEAHGDVPDSIVVREHAMRMLIRPRVGQKTGTFLDQREHRAMIRHLSAGREVVNLFAYHGGFSVAAALGGASRVHTVDIAPEAVADARENFVLNGLEPAAHVFDAADAFTWRRDRPVGLWIVDPPSLARGDKARATATRAYRKLHRDLHTQLVRDGLLATSSCTAQVAIEDWKRALTEGLSRGGSWSWLHQSAAPPDHPTALAHPEGHYLKFALLRLLDAGARA